MSKYDKEREAMGFAPVASSASSGKSKYDSDRVNYRHSNENTQYADLMKQAYQSNPESFTQPEPVQEDGPSYLDNLKSLIPTKEALSDVFSLPNLKRAGKTVVDTIKRPSELISEYATPNAPLIREDGIIPGTNARQSFLERTGQRPAEGFVEKGFGMIAAPFAVPGAGLGAGTGLYRASDDVLQAFAPRLQNTLGGRVASEGIREAAVGGAIGAGQELAVGTGNLKDAAISGAVGLGLGAVLGAGGKYAGTKIGQGLENWRANRAAPQVEQQLRPPIAGQRGIDEPLTFTEGSPATPEQPLPGVTNQNPTLKESVTAEWNNARKADADFHNSLKEKYGEDFSGFNGEKYLTPDENKKWDDIRTEFEKARDNFRNKVWENGPTATDNQVASKYDQEREQILKEQTAPEPIEDVVQHAEPRIRDKVVNYLDEAEQAAWDRLKAKRNTLSSNPVDQYMDYSIILAAKLGKGVVKLADATEFLVSKFGEEIRPHVKAIFSQAKVMHKEATIKAEKEMQGLKDIDPTTLKDFSGFKYNTSDIYRNFKDVFGDKFPQMKEAILDPLDASKLDNVNMQKEWLDKLHTHVVDGLGIEKGSKLSALVQRFGEKQIDLDKLKSLAPKDWEKVVKADKFFREAYDTLIDQVNKTREQIYPHNSEKIVPKRSDYYRHFQEFSSLTGLKNLFDTPAQIDPNLVGMSEFTLPKSKFAGFMQKRGLGPFKNDAVGGFLNYVPSASYATHIDPQIEVFKRLAKNLASETEETKNINGFIEFLQKYSQDLAGKTNSLDRAFQEYVPGGRKTMGVINWLNNRVKSNTILGNVSSTIAQIANVPTGIAFAKQHAFKGAGKTLISAIKGNPLHDQSQFLKERFIGKEYRKFDTRWLDLQNPLRTKSTAIWAMETADRMGTEFIWNSAYEKAVKEGIPNPIKYADDNARRLIAGRGIGEVPLMQKSKLFQAVAPFTLEVANLWRVQKDFIKQKDFAGIAMLMIGSYAFNKVAEEIKGSGVVFDPIQAIVEASVEGLSPVERAGRLAGEVISNVPLGSTLASLYPEYGTEIMGAKLPTRKKFFGDNDPTRFGSGLIAIKGLQDPLYKVLPGFGGNQIKKTIDGAQSIANSGAKKDGELKYPISMTPTNIAKSLAFGPNSTKEAQSYFDKERRPLTEDETKFVEKSPNPQKAYEDIQISKRMTSLKASITKISNDKKKTPTEKDKEIKGLIRKINEINTAK